MADLVYIRPGVYINPEAIAFVQEIVMPKGIRIDFLSGRYLIIPDISTHQLQKQIQEST